MKLQIHRILKFTAIFGNIVFIAGLIYFIISEEFKSQQNTAMNDFNATTEGEKVFYAALLTLLVINTLVLLRKRSRF